MPAAILGAPSPPGQRRRDGGTPFTARWAHGDGNYFANATLDRLEGQALVAFRYETNRNGAARGIVEVLSPNLRVLGMMPHPENASDPLMGGKDRLALFRSFDELFEEVGGRF